MTSIQIILRHTAQVSALFSFAIGLSANILTSQTKIQLSSKSVSITFVNFAVFGLTSIRQLPLPPLYRSL